MLYKTVLLLITFITPQLYADSLTQVQLFDAVMNIRSIITTKVQGIENYQLRRSPFWLQRSLIEWQLELKYQVDRIMASMAANDAPYATQRLVLFTTAVTALGDSLAQLNAHSIQPGIVQALAQTILQMCNDLIIEMNAKTTAPINQPGFDQTIPDYLYQHPEIDELFTKRLKGINKAG